MRKKKEISQIVFNRNKNEKKILSGLFKRLLKNYCFLNNY